ncbi:M24 family metallopeptidase [Halobacterium yunchengense]|uniref:M24 family metallopeptidase n=1 Tax=Halobacterium yunchengense TaxID=3108497 RepID=UPI00300AD680
MTGSLDAPKLARLDDLLAERGLEAVWLARPGGFAWLTGGDNVVDRDGDVGVAAAGYDGDGVTVVASNVEAARLREEEVPSAVDVAEYDWHREGLAAAVAERTPRPAAADFDVPGLATVDVSDRRQPLTERDRARYRDLGERVAAAVEDVAAGFERGATERAVAARLRQRLEREGVRAPVVLVGGDDRARRYRHYTPSDAAVDEYALLSVTAERGGLFASCTRTVAFDAPGWLAERHRAAARVEATALAATQSAAAAGGTAADVFAAIRDAYDAVGFPDEWRAHHQGGAAGFAGREWIGTPDGGERVTAPMAYAWNPTVRGAKSEDTVLVAGDDLSVLTATGDWPTLTASAVDADVDLQRPAVLER